MKNSSSNDWLIPLLAAFAIYVPLSTTAPSPDQRSSAQSQSPALIQMVPAATPTPTPGPGRVSGEGARLLCDFFGLKPDQSQKAGLNPQQKAEVETRKGDYCRIKSVLNSKVSKRPPPSGYDEIEYLIATVPDPNDTRLDHQFDRALDAIRRALESADYTFDRFWLPWDRSRTVTSPISTVDPRIAQMATRHLRDPGVILFRDSRSKKLLLLFLVGETPTGGIHRVAFQNALRQIKELPRRVGSMTEEPAQKKPLLILGPYFPSSANSLAILLKGWMDGQKSPPNFRIITGSTGLIDKDYFLNYLAPAEVSFYTTVINAEQVINLFNTYLSNLDPQIRPLNDGSPARAYIAVLSEAGTGVGQILRWNIWELNLSEKQPRVLSLTYPVHISQLRVEEAKSSSRNEPSNAPAVKDANLPLPMSETGSPGPKDIAPLFSPLETVTMELALSEILTAIHRERIRYVRVSAADPQDRIFLVHEIRKHCPNVRILTTSADLLYLHPESNLDFQGTLVISSYPLFALNQLWTYPFEGDRWRPQFPTPTEQGIFNATLALLDKTDLMLEYGFPFKKYNVSDERCPAFWLGVVGRNGIWPVKTFDNKPEETSCTLPITTKFSTSAPRLGLSDNYRSPTGAGFLLLIGVICLILSLSLLAQLILFWGRSRMDQTDPDQWRGRRSIWSRAIIEPILKIARQVERGNEGTLLRPLVRIRRGLLGQVFGDEEFYCYRLERRINLLGCCVSLLTASLFISGVAMLPAWILWNAGNGNALQVEWGRHLAIGVVASAILVFTLGAFIWLMVGVSMWVISGWRHFHRRIWVLLGLVVCAATITFVGLGLFKVYFEFETPEKVFFFLRATELTSGVSILLPALLVGLAAFLSFFATLRRLNLAERMPCLRNPRQRPDDAPQFLRFDHERAKSFEGLKSLEDRVKEMIICPIFKTPGAALLTVLISIVY